MWAGMMTAPEMAQRAPSQLPGKVAAVYKNHRSEKFYRFYSTLFSELKKMGQG